MKHNLDDVGLASSSNLSVDSLSEILQTEGREQGEKRGQREGGTTRDGELMMESDSRETQSRSC